MKPPKSDKIITVALWSFIAAVLMIEVPDMPERIEHTSKPMQQVLPVDEGR